MTDGRQGLRQPQPIGDRFGDLPAPPRPLALAVPNVSEGRHQPTIDALADACRVPGVRVADLHSDADHHRTVISLVGDPLAIQEALVALAAEAMERIDLRRHVGVHPRVGALDVAPIVALTPEELPLARELAAAVSEQIAADLGLAVFGYGEIASHRERDRPHHFRLPGLEWITDEMAAGRMRPDAGPARVHPSAGVVLVGARLPLVALNVWLPEATLTEARAIAAQVREAGGGPLGLRALGLYLHEVGMAQVSMNIEDHRATPPVTAIRAVRRAAERLGVETGEVELVGLVPAEAIAGISPAALGIRGFRPGHLVDLHLGRLRGS